MVATNDVVVDCSLSCSNVWRERHWVLWSYGCHTVEPPGYFGLTRRINTPSQKVMMCGIVEDDGTNAAMMSW